MAPSAVVPETSTATKQVSSSPDWLSDLYANGFAVIKGAIPQERALAYQAAAHAWVTSFGTELDLKKPETWITANLPAQSKINTFRGYSLAHEKFMWDARLEAGVLAAFERIWGTNELLVSFDTLNITLPNRRDVPRKPTWEHVDQSPFRHGLQCVQGIINLSPSGPEDGGLVVYPNSHKLLEEFFATQTDQALWEQLDRYMFDAKELDWFHDRGSRPFKVCAEVGDLIVWDSRLIHYGSEPTEKSSQIRTIIYASYTPAQWAHPDQLALKRDVFYRFGGTTHWPHDNIVARPTQVLLEDGTRDPRDRDQPLQLPEMTDKLLKLAGAKSY